MLDLAVARQERLLLDLEPLREQGGMRRQWQDPCSGAACEVQASAGEELARRLGARPARDLLAQVHEGRRVVVTGHVQAQTAGPSSGRLEIVCHALEFLPGLGRDPMSGPRLRRPPRGGSGLSERKRALSGFLGELLGAGHVIKAGFGLAYDLRRLAESYPALPCFGGGGGPVVTVAGHVDVLRLARATSLSVQHPGPVRLSLATLTARVIGRRMDKAQQCSAWGARPLTPEQVSYAAADAACLVDMFDRLVASYPEVLASPAWRKELAGPAVDLAAIAAAAKDPLEGLLPPLPPPVAQPAPRQRQPRWRQPTGAPTEVRDAELAAMRALLGQPFAEGGRAIVVRTAAAGPGEPLPGFVPRYPRGGGLVPWRNAVFLFVNVLPPESAPYPNAFLDGGRRITWYPSPAHSSRHPLMLRMLGAELCASGSAAPSAGTMFGDATETPLLSAAALPETLRYPSKDWEGSSAAAGKLRPFICCGRLVAARVDWAAAGGYGEVVWTLLDYEDLAGSKHFQALLQVGGLPV
ncbi:hypothetical protein WJX81_004674 [Elliptochloris bilobata]|uniref:3'-5' exonuclease domain-containing protein n=1 Tax=Elliptochloris bilobata TaxID=381761 RepID=A0AAW1SEP2_9CHLO